MRLGIVLLHVLFFCFFGSGLSLSCGGDVYCVPSSYASFAAAIAAAGSSFPITIALDGPHAEDVVISVSGGSSSNPSIIRTLDSTPQTLTAASTDQPVIHFDLVATFWRVDSPEGNLTLSLPGSGFGRPVISNSGFGNEIVGTGLRFHTSGPESSAIGDYSQILLRDFSSSQCTTDGTGSWGNLITISGNDFVYPMLIDIQIDSACCIDSPIYISCDGAPDVKIRNLYFVQNSANTIPISINQSPYVYFYNSVFRSEVSPVTTMIELREDSRLHLINSYIHCAAASGSYSSSTVSFQADFGSPYGWFENVFWDGCSSGSEYLVNVFEDNSFWASGDWSCNRYSGPAQIANAGSWTPYQTCPGVGPGPIPIKRGNLGSVGPGSGWKEYYSLTEQVVGSDHVSQYPDFFGVERDLPFSIGPHEFQVVCNGINAKNNSVCSGRGNCTESGCLCHVPEDWTGDDCEIVACYGIAESNESAVCGGHGTCESDHTCTCDGIYEDRSRVCDDFKCEDDVWFGDGGYCSGNGVCNSTHAECVCENNYEDKDGQFCYSFRCEDDVWFSDGGYCSGNGVCNSTHADCVCENNYENKDGQFCSSFRCEDGDWFVEGSSCSSHGSCTAADATCSCDAPYVDHLAFCDDFMCEDGNWSTGDLACFGHGGCDATDDTCECETGWEGLYCRDQTTSSLGNQNDQGAGVDVATVVGGVVGGVVVVAVVLLLVIGLIVLLCVVTRAKAKTKPASEVNPPEPADVELPEKESSGE